MTEAFSALYSLSFADNSSLFYAVKTKSMTMTQRRTKLRDLYVVVVDVVLTMIATMMIITMIAAPTMADQQQKSAGSGVDGAAAAGGGRFLSPASSSLTSTCERITIPMCMDTGYNVTRMPNYMGHTSQADAAIHVHEFLPLVQIGCSRHLKFFLCSLYAPMCADQVNDH